jgi:DNA helicase II / ATP-dependent DNA helicase PcrA
MSMISITSDTLFTDIEHHFRISAGPGAGKTHWLVEHIKNVLLHSNRLFKTRKIACITYTNIAVETILDRLGTSADKVEVSTIHSFLYKHIVKPYVLFIATDYSLNVADMDGHDEHIVSLKKVLNWVENHPNKNSLIHPYTVNQLTKLDDNKKAIYNWLASLSYKFHSSGSLVISSDRSEAYYYNNERRYLNKKCLDILETAFIEYKKLYWQEGTLHHDDVLFFSYQIIQKYPFVLQVLRAKFPYFFVDEFQDTNPIQAAILNQIGQRETIVGIIGNKAQSIYGFQGAEPAHFYSFSLPGMVDYQMAENRRSTNQIIDILNHIRNGDIEQIKYKDIDGERPVILIGEMSASLRKAKELCNGEQVYSLSRDNITSNAMKQEINGVSLERELFEKLIEKDPPSNSNNYRSRVVVACVKATELAREGKFKDAIKELERIFKDRDDKEKGRREALKHIQTLMKKYNEFSKNSLYDFYSVIKSDVKPGISKLKGGAVKLFCDEHTYQQLAFCVKIPEDMSFHKTIHKAKGDEFDNVLLVLKNEADLEFLLNPNLNPSNSKSEEQRIYYVAVSRAKKRLFINIPSLSEEGISKLKSMFTLDRV